MLVLGCASSAALTNTNSSSKIGVTENIRPVTGRVTKAMSSVLFSISFKISRVSPVFTVIWSDGNRSLSCRKTGGSRWMQAVAPVPSRTRPA